MEQVYDTRTISRLHEMCNFIGMVGPDRRANAKPRPFKATKETEDIAERISLADLKGQNPQLHQEIVQKFYQMAEKNINKPRKVLQTKPLTQNSYLEMLAKRIPEAETEELHALLDQAKETDTNGKQKAPEIIEMIESELQTRNHKQAS